MREKIIKKLSQSGCTNTISLLIELTINIVKKKKELTINIITTATTIILLL
jgi:hypothetical protein